jgi:hypothetical protein
MKKFLTLLGFILAFWTQMQAQNGGTPFFDPSVDPVAIRTDTNLQLIVSEYVLMKSVAARLGQNYRVNKVYLRKLTPGADRLIFEGTFTNNIYHRYTMIVNLIPDATGKFYRSSNTAIECEKEGCNLCDIEADGNCTPCCEKDGTGNNPQISFPMIRVPINFD